MTTTWAAWRAQAATMDVDGLAVATYDIGPAGREPITFLHGYPSSSLDVAPVLDELGPAWRVLTLDLPGFGASPAPPGTPHTIHAAADVVEQLWRERGVASTVVLAHDYSVSVAQELLARRAERTLAADVRAVVLCNGGLYPDLHRPTVGQRLLLDPEGGAALAAGMTEEAFTSGVLGTWGTRRPADPHVLHELWRSMADTGAVHRMHELLHYIAERRTHADRWGGALGSTDVPLAFAWGDLDPVSGAHMIERVEERLPTADVVRLADVGHWPTLEAPDVVAAVVTRAAAQV